MKLRELGEFPFLHRLRQRVPSDPRVLLGIGDDCAALSLPGTTVVTTDAMIENVHFRREWTSFYSLGEKAFATNASDIAAMGAEPTFALLSIGAPLDCEVEDLDAFFEGFVHAAHLHDTTLIGGNMSAAPCFMISVTLLGQASNGIVKRAGACPGDDLYVTGAPGDAALGLRLLQEQRDDAPARVLKSRFLLPTARVTVGREVARRHLATAMIDISDGLLQDLGHLCEASEVGARIEASALPLSPEYCAVMGDHDFTLALTGGEAYELLFTVSPDRQADIAAIAEKAACRVTCIGRIVPRAEGVRVYGSDGKSYTPTQAGYDHFHQA
jgi:thiamine-monophosphate kinase